MNLLRKSFASSISLTTKPSLVSLYISSLLRGSRFYSVHAVGFEKNNSAINDVTECNTISGSLIAQRRFMSTSKGRSMRSKVEKRMQRETGKTLREMRRAKKLRKKLMTEDERLVYNLRRAKKKVALLLQKLKKYELPDLPPPRHDPELFTEEQLQAYKKIGFRNRNYVPVGVRGVFGGVVQNMHLHWKFHETVQVCCDNFPKEKIKEMATMLARLSGGIVVNIHDVKTIIMFRGRNYRQPKNLIPLNTLTKRKALFKARFEQALESQQLNIKKIEQLLRRKGINPEDPVHMASIQRVASTFFRAIDEQEGTPYVFRQPETVPEAGLLGRNEDIKFDPKPENLEEDSDQEELDRYIKEIEDAADQEWEEEEAADREEEIRIRYWNKEDYENRRRQQFHGGSDNSESSEGEVWDEEEDNNGDDFSKREVKVRSEDKGGFGHTKNYRSRELNASKRATHDRFRNGSHRDGYREDSLNKSRGRSRRVEFDSGSYEDFGNDKGFKDTEGYGDIGHRRSKRMVERVRSGSGDESRVNVDVGERAEFMSDDELWESDKDFRNKGFIPTKGYGDFGHRRSSKMDKRVESWSDDEQCESDEDFSGYKRFSHSQGQRDIGGNRLRWAKSESESLDSDEGEELSVAASRDYGYDYLSNSDGYEKRDRNNGTVTTVSADGHLGGKSGKKNSDESWDSD
ncbi:RNA-binding CRS1 / YhbY (CRM) domain protein [Rhynchospora pubera]|uniref:RNA-binding CRS1 / YhbY (CRM) domain protein n=1 Tax=Rhynchospora pubera TaxID=906938 RepID=A0AAV8HTN9_9POAL|nr:RNA-binding CRS1 / YhbY (CRM) domain protein [Rhynchospora pubera]